MTSARTRLSGVGRKGLKNLNIMMMMIMMMAVVVMMMMNFLGFEYTV
jgi:hypothetical protein